MNENVAGIPRVHTGTGDNTFCLLVSREFVVPQLLHGELVSVIPHSS